MFGLLRKSWPKESVTDDSESSVACARFNRLTFKFFSMIAHSFFSLLIYLPKKMIYCSSLCVDHVEHEFSHGVLGDEALNVVQDVLVQHQLHQVESTWGTI